MAGSKRLVAKEDLYVGRHRAHVKGDLVPAENVERNGWEGKVVGADTKAAAEARDSGGAPA